MRPMRTVAGGAALGVLGALAVVLILKRPSAPEDPAVALPVSGEDPVPLPAAARSLALADDDATQDCLEALAVPESSSALMGEQRRLALESVLDRQEGAVQRELVADLAGYRPRREEVFASGFSAGMFWRYAPPPPPGQQRLSEAAFRELEDLRRREGIEGLLGADASALQALWRGGTYAGYLIREHGEAIHAALPAVAGRLALGLHELAIAIEAGVGEAEFVTLLAAAAADPAAVWHNGANLARLAAIHNRPAILRILIAHGVDPAAAPRWPTGRSVLDDIASRLPATGAEAAGALADVVRLLAAAGDRPRLPSTLSTLAQWLPEASLPALHPESAALVALLADAAATVAALDAQWSAKIDAATRLERRCERARELAAPADQLGSGLAAKRRQQEALAVRAERALEELRPAPEADGGEDEAFAGLRDALRTAVADGRWDDAIAVADQLGGYAPMVLLQIALGSSDAPLEVLLALVERNHGLLPPNAAEYLAASRRGDAARIAEALEPYGLDLNYVDALGRNAFGVLAGTLLESDGAWQFAEYLASRSVPVKPSAWGLDPLDRVLTSLVAHPRISRHRIRFARFLIDHGAPVEPSHLELAAQLAVRDEDAHRRLLSRVPELAS